MEIFQSYSMKDEKTQITIFSWSKKKINIILILI